VLKEKLLLDLATRRPREEKDLRRLPSFDPRQAARDADTWLRLLAEAEEAPEFGLPPRIEGKPFSAAVRELEDRLRDKVRERAVELNVPPEILAPRRALDALLRLNLGHPEPRLPRELDGWRREAIGETLLREARA
jgi:ribonuclease D